MSKSKPIPDPSLPLKPLYERFCVEQSLGRGLADSYATAKGVENTPDSTNSLKVSAHRISKRPEIVARIRQLKLELLEKKRREVAQINVDDDWSRESILAIIMETTAVLEETGERLKNDPDVSEVTRRRYFQILSSHLSRQWSHINNNGGDAIELPTTPTDVSPLQNLEFCKCT